MPGPAPPALVLGVNSCFAVKRWPEAGRWVDLVVGDLGLDECQVTLDLFEPDLGSAAAERQAGEIRRAAEEAGLALHSTFTGLAAYSSNLLLHPAPEVREASTAWFERAVELTALLGARGTGGFVGALSVADAAEPARRRALMGELAERLARISERAAAAGLELLLMENMAVPREPGSFIEEAHQLEAATSGCPVPWVLCLDLGHPCALRNGPPSDDPLAWLTEPWRRTPVLQLQQADRDGDHHWPFTDERNRSGLVRAAEVVETLRRLHTAEVHLFFEVIHPHEAPDEQVLADLRQSVDHWRSAVGEPSLAGSGGTS